MKIQIVSDLHFEFYRDGGKSVADLLAPLSKPYPADALVVAGDLASSKTLLGALHLLAERVPTLVYVPGNHDFYGASPDDLVKIRGRAEREIPNLRWLEEGSTYLGDVRILGTPLWFRQDPMAAVHRGGLADFSAIRDFEPWVYEKNRRAVRFLEDNLREGDVVVTHHLPSRKSVVDRYAGSPLNAFFVYDVEALIRDRQPALWVHGHTHDSCDYAIGETRVVCNPLGYPNERNTEFNPRLVVEV